MTPRERRLLRLVQLRERQHRVAALHLRAARGDLAAAESAASDAQQCTRAAQLLRSAAATDSNRDEWLLASAEVEIRMLVAASHQAKAARIGKVVQQAAEIEMAARRERRQMEASLEVVRSKCAEQATRAEQATLDEIARMQKAESTARGTWRREL